MARSDQRGYSQGRRSQLAYEFPVHRWGCNDWFRLHRHFLRSILPRFMERVEWPVRHDTSLGMLNSTSIVASISLMCHLDCQRMLPHRIGIRNSHDHCSRERHKQVWQKHGTCSVERQDLHRHELACMDFESGRDLPLAARGGVGVCGLPVP